MQLLMSMGMALYINLGMVVFFTIMAL